MVAAGVPGAGVAQTMEFPVARPVWLRSSRSCFWCSCPSIFCCMLGNLLVLLYVQRTWGRRRSTRWQGDKEAIKNVGLFHPAT